MSKRWQAVLFDLDGTLLPMDNDYFIKVYFHYLAKTVGAWGYEDEELLIRTVWQGVAAMVRNDGTRKNSDRFWETFAGVYGQRVYDDIPRFNSFYENEFNQAREAAHPTEQAKEAVAAARESADHVILATSPVFPASGVATRLSWLELSLADFDLVTDYDNSRFCKPNPAYYRDILERFGLDPARCVMVGNDVEEDERAAAGVGMPGFLVTDYLIDRKGTGFTCPGGDYRRMIDWLRGES